jgi:DNA invertase Pin-like site-specific DNA recombinase
MNEFGSSVGSTRTNAIHGSEFGPLPPCCSSRLRSFHIRTLFAIDEPKPQQKAHGRCRIQDLSNTRPTSAYQGLARCVSPLHENPMPKAHTFAAAPVSKGRARAVSKPAVTVYGYARVSTGGQSVDAQARQLRAVGAGKVFREVASGAVVDRPQLRRLLSEVAAGDVVMVTRLDRLARSTRDLLNTLAAITEKKAGFRSLGDAWADTTTAHGRLMLTVLGGLAEFERELIRTRTGRAVRAPRRPAKVSAAGRSSPHTRRRKRFAAATKASQSARLRAPTMSVRVRFHG